MYCFVGGGNGIFYFVSIYGGNFIFLWMVYWICDDVIEDGFVVVLYGVDEYVFVGWVVFVVNVVIGNVGGVFCFFLDYLVGCCWKVNCYEINVLMNGCFW